MDNLFDMGKPGIRTSGLATAQVRAAEDHMFLVEIGGCLRKVERAAGCLIEPIVNDRVLVFDDPDGMCYIVAVLSRQSETPAIMSFGHGVSVTVGEGAFDVESPDVRFTAGKELSLSGDTLKIRAHEGEARIDNLSFLGLSLISCLETIRLTARTVDTAAERLVQRLKRCYRTVEEFEESKIGRLRCLIQKNFFLRSQNAAVMADEVVKVNGEKILLG